MIKEGLEALERIQSNYVYVFKARENGKTQLIHDLNTIKKELKALEIVKVLFQGRARLYERNDGIEQTIDKNGNYHKCNCVIYILDFHSGMIHYEFHLHKDEYDLLKEVLI